MFFPSQTSRFRGTVVFCLGVVSTCTWQLCLPSLAAQPLNEELWRHISAADTNINACQVSWRTIFTDYPSPIDIEKSVARTTEELRKQGVGEADLPQMAQNARESAQSVESGSKRQTLYDLVRQGNTIRCEIQQSPSVALNTSLAPIKTHRINFYDGKNIINLEQLQISKEAQAKEQLPASITSGELRRDGKEILPQLGADNLSVLAGTPILSEFSPENSTMREAAGDTLLLERQAGLDGPSPRLFRVVISKRTWRPLTSETINLVNNGVIRRLKFSNYKNYTGDIWFPGQVLDEHLNSQGKVNFAFSHSLQKASFNEAADVSILSKPLPVSATINDHRFAPRTSVPFTSNTGAIPDDNKILKLVEESEVMQKKIEQSRQAQQRSKALPLTIFFGISLIVAGGLLWRQSKRSPPPH